MTSRRFTWTFVDTVSGEQPITLRGSFYEDINQDVIAALLSAGSFNSVLTHALVSGQYLYETAPSPDLMVAKPDTLRSRITAPVGTVFASQLQHLAVKAGEVTETLPAAPIGLLDEEALPDLRRVAELAWDRITSPNPGVLASVFSPEEPAADQALLPVQECMISTLGGDEATRLLHTLRSEVETLALTPPSDLSAVYSGASNPNKAGTNGTRLTRMVFVDGETRPLGYNVLGALLRRGVHLRGASLTDPQFAMLKDLSRDLLKTPSGFLGYAGLYHLDDYVTSYLSILDSLTIEGYVALTGMLATYVNLLNGWNLALFPWHLDQHLVKGIS